MPVYLLNYARSFKDYARIMLENFSIYVCSIQGRQEGGGARGAIALGLEMLGGPDMARDHMDSLCK